MKPVDPTDTLVTPADLQVSFDHEVSAIVEAAMQRVKVLAKQAEQAARVSQSPAPL